MIKELVGPSCGERPRVYDLRHSLFGLTVTGMTAPALIKEMLRWYKWNPNRRAGSSRPVLLRFCDPRCRDLSGLDRTTWYKADTLEEAQSSRPCLRTPGKGNSQPRSKLKTVHNTANSNHRAPQETVIPCNPFGAARTQDVDFHTCMEQPTHLDLLPKSKRSTRT